jgi:hypothetical protein
VLLEAEAASPATAEAGSLVGVVAGTGMIVDGPDAGLVVDGVEEGVVEAGREVTDEGAAAAGPAAASGTTSAADAARMNVASRSRDRPLCVRRVIEREPPCAEGGS